MAEIDVLKAQLVRPHDGADWGFRLQGGSHPQQPIIIASVQPMSPADKIGLKPGDEVTEIGDTPTSNLTIQQAMQALQHYGLSLILTVERRAHGPVPTNPVVSSSQQNQVAPDLKHYQPYDLSHPAPRHPPYHAPAHQPAQNVEFHTVSARPYEPPPTPYPPPAPSQHDSSNNGRHYHHGPSDYGHYDEDLHVNGAHQSRSFKMLASLMQNEEQYAGSSGLPPPRSAAMERQKAQQAQAAQYNPNPSRVKVFMPQQYNTPLGMYSAHNIMDTFQNQAEGHLEQQSQANNPTTMTSTQQVVLQQDQAAASGHSEF